MIGNPCRPTDLAVGIPAPQAQPENIGGFFDVIRPCACLTNAWQVKPRQPCFGITAVHFVGVLYEECAAGGDCCLYDAHLKPIRPGTSSPAKEQHEDLAHSS